MRVFAVVVVHNPDMPTSGNQRKLEFWKKNGIYSKQKHRKVLNSILSGRFGDPYGKPGDFCRIRESWHV